MKRRGNFTFTVDQDFEAVMRGCATVPRPKPIGEVGADESPAKVESESQNGRTVIGLDDSSPDGIENNSPNDAHKTTETWITPEMHEAYVSLHRAGFAHSVEARELADGKNDDEIIGGIYGVEFDGHFAAESMFYKKPYASKLALLHLIETLRAKSIGWIDIQVMTPHMQSMGAELISRSEFLKMIRR